MTKRKLSLMPKLRKKKLADGESLKDHLTKLRGFKSDLGSAGGSISDSDWKNIILNSLTGNWKSYRVGFIAVSIQKQSFRICFTKQKKTTMTTIKNPKPIFRQSLRYKQRLDNRNEPRRSVQIAVATSTLRKNAGMETTRETLRTALKSALRGAGGSSSKR